ncbi:hypothetical protein Leryth_014021 [Lithospermum erythrorhizon]|nr:hypothetical protein Leryth_014021 [Lithospermum erythrorhizon]
MKGGPQGQVFGGAVVGSLASAGTIYLIAATFNNPTYQRLPVDDNNEARNAGVISGGGGGGNEGRRHHSPPAESAGGGSRENQMGMYSTFQSDVIWAPTARPPPPY